MQDAPLSPETKATIDRLIPPPWSRRRRLATWAAIGALSAGFTYLWAGGWLFPNLELMASQWGGDGPVTVGVQITNNGARSITVLGTDTGPGLELVSATVADEPVPVVVDPGRSAIVVSTYRVVDCDLIDREDTSWGIEVEFSDGPLRMRRTVQFLSDGFFDERLPSGSRAAWAGAATQYACP